MIPGGESRFSESPPDEQSGTYQPSANAVARALIERYMPVGEAAATTLGKPLAASRENAANVEAEAGSGETVRDAQHLRSRSTNESNLPSSDGPSVSCKKRSSLRKPRPGSGSRGNRAGGGAKKNVRFASRQSTVSVSRQMTQIPEPPSREEAKAAYVRRPAQRACHADRRDEDGTKRPPEPPPGTNGCFDSRGRLTDEPVTARFFFWPQSLTMEEFGSRRGRRCKRTCTVHKPRKWHFPPSSRISPAQSSELT